MACKILNNGTLWYVGFILKISSLHILLHANNWWMQLVFWTQESWIRIIMYHGWCTLVEWGQYYISSLSLLNKFSLSLNWHETSCLWQIINVADDIGDGVHFNPFVDHNDKVLAYVRIHFDVCHFVNFILVMASIIDS